MYKSIHLIRCLKIKQKEKLWFMDGQLCRSKSDNPKYFERKEMAKCHFMSISVSFYSFWRSLELSLVSKAIRRIILICENTILSQKAQFRGRNQKSLLPLSSPISSVVPSCSNRATRAAFFLCFLPS